MPAPDASSPAIVTGNSVTSVTTAAFTPPNDHILVAESIWDTTGTPAAVIEITNNGAALTWTQQKHLDGSTTGQDGVVAIWTAPLPVGRSITVTSTPTNTGLSFDERGGLKVYAVPADMADPVGATGSGQSTTNDITPTVYTSTVDNSRGYGCASNKTDRGLPVSSDEEHAFTIGSAVEGMANYKASVTTPSGSGVTLNFDAFGTGTAQWNWIAVEILPPGAPPPPDVRVPNSVRMRAMRG